MTLEELRRYKPQILAIADDHLPPLQDQLNEVIKELSHE